MSKTAKTARHRSGGLSASVAALVESAAAPADLPPLLRVPDLAAVLGMTTNGVRALIARGELPASKLGRQWIVRRDALLTRLRALERRPPSVDLGEVLRAMTKPRLSRKQPTRADMDRALRAADSPS